MLDKLIANPILFYTIFVSLSILIFLIVFLIVNRVKKILERKKLKNTSDIILNEHYEDDSNTTLEEEINKLEEKAKQNEEPVTQTFEVENKFIKGEPIQIEIDSDISNEEEKTSMQNILSKMQEDLTKKDEKSIFEFEQEQEQNAIISYQELLKANGKEVVETVEKQKFDLNKFFDNMNSSVKHNYNVDEINKASDLSVITIDDIKDDTINEIKENNSKTIKPSNIDEGTKEKKKFKMSEFISPIYGRMETKLDYPTIPNESQIKEKSISDLTDDEFLKVLKAFRENL